MSKRKSVSEVIEEREAKRAQGDWFPASGGTERPFRARSGRRLQYLYQPSTGNHAYIDVETDIILTDREASRELGGMGDTHTQVPWVEAAVAVGVALVIFALVRSANPSAST